MSKMKPCNTCGAEIAANAKVCPACGAKNKKPIYKRVWFIILMIIIVLAIIGSLSGGSSSSSGTANDETTAKQTTEQTAEQNTEQTAEPEITYTKYDVSELADDLENNAMKASEKYKNQYVELTGKLEVIDSNGKYISLSPADNQIRFVSTIQCYVKSAEQKDVILSANIGDTLSVKGKITDVGEVLGYSLNMDEISPAQ